MNLRQRSTSRQFAINLNIKKNKIDVHWTFICHQHITIQDNHSTDYWTQKHSMWKSSDTSLCLPLTATLANWGKNLIFAQSFQDCKDLFHTHYVFACLTQYDDIFCAGINVSRITYQCFLNLRMDPWSNSDWFVANYKMNSYVFVKFINCFDWKFNWRFCAWRYFAWTAIYTPSNSYRQGKPAFRSVAEYWTLLLNELFISTNAHIQNL